MCAEKTHDKRLKVVLCWHMHQPHYRDANGGPYRLPWTYLHAIKDYVDMAAHLEAVPGARAVVNLVPTLIEQIDEYADQVRDFLAGEGAIADPLLAALAGDPLPGDATARNALVRACLRANEERLINRFPHFRRLADMAVWMRSNPDLAAYVGDQFLVDLLVWYHLAWLGESVRLSDKRVKALMAKGLGYGPDDRRTLVTVMGELLAGVIPRYRALAEKGRVELSVTPYAHPIAPLLVDIASTHDAMPGAPLPAIDGYPGGGERLRWHIREGIEVFERHFGFRPKGCWPAEGAVSAEALRYLGEEGGFLWAATGEGVLRNSLRNEVPAAPHCGGGLFHPYRLEGLDIATFFRDDGLSDLIGFTYAKWHADDAVADFVHHLQNIARACNHVEGSVVSVILDGENAWEYYPENGYHFLRALYQRLADHPEIRLTTFGECLEAHCVEVYRLPRMVAGSWVYGTFSTWIGERDKNRGWEMLAEAKVAFDAVVASGRLTGAALAAAERQLAICEGSDWFWWFGDYNPAEAVSDFESLFRNHLNALYEMIGEAPPKYLTSTFTHGGGDPAAGGVMRQGKAH